MEIYLNALLDWTQMHPHWAGVAVFVISCLESFLVIGLFVPGTVVMFGFGALVAAGAMDLTATLIWAILGAIAGDGISFFIGRHFHQRLRVLWPFRKYPTLMNRGVDFFHHHGGKSIIFARFVGPVRPILPAVAGMLNMAPSRFFLVNGFSALIWAPAYLLPGLVFGASLGLAAEVAGRLALLLGLLIALIWFSVWLVRRMFRSIQPHAAEYMAHALTWSQRHPTLYPLAAALLDPQHPEARGMTVLVSLLVAASWVFMITFQQVLDQSLLYHLDQLLFYSLQELRTPWTDYTLTVFSQLGDGLVLTTFLLVLSLWFALRGYWRVCLHWLAAFFITALLTRIIKITTALDRPMEMYSGMDSFSFPSSHASLSVVAYGFLAVVVARELPVARRWIPYVLATMLCVPIAFSRLYLGAHWLTDVLGGICLGLFWLALFGIAYRTHPGPAIPVQRTAILALSVLLLVGGWNLQQNFASALERYQPQRSITDWTLPTWRDRLWAALPAYRADLEGKHQHPLQLQWAAPLEEIDTWLTQQGWEKPTRLTMDALLSEFTALPSLHTLPVMPQVHDGRHEVLRRVYYQDQTNSLVILRLWSSDVRIEDLKVPLWIGNVSLLERHTLLGLITTLRTQAEFSLPYALFTAQAQHWPKQQARNVIDTDGSHREQLLLWSTVQEGR